MNISRLFNSVFLRDALSLSGGTAIAQAITFITLPILTRLYSPEDFGILALYVAISSMLSIFATLKIEQIIMLPDSDSDAVRALYALFVIGFVFSLCVFIVILFFMEYIVQWIQKPDLRVWMYFMPLSVFLFSCYQGLRFWLMRRKQFKLVSISLISAIVIGSLVSIVIGLSFNHMFIGPAGLLIGYVVEGFIRPVIMLNGFFCRSGNMHSINLRKIFEVVIEYKQLVSTLLVSHGISALYSRMLIVAIEVMYGSVILGYFSMAHKVISAPPALISNALGDVFRQRASVAWREHRDFSTLFRKTLLLSSTIGIPLYLIAIIVAPDAFSLILGEQWRIAGQYASIIMISGVFAFIATPIDKGAIIVGAYRYIFMWHFVRLLLYITSIGIIYFVSYDFIYLLYAIVAVDICLWVIDCIYEYIFSLGKYT